METIAYMLVHVPCSLLNNGTSSRNSFKIYSAVRSGEHNWIKILGCEKEHKPNAFQQRFTTRYPTTKLKRDGSFSKKKNLRETAQQRLGNFMSYYYITDNDGPFGTFSPWHLFQGIMAANALIPSVSSHAFCLPLPSVRCQFLCGTTKLIGKAQTSLYFCPSANRKSKRRWRPFCFHRSWPLSNIFWYSTKLGTVCS